MPIHGSREGCVDFGFRAGLQDLELQALCVCCLLRRVDDAPGLRIVRVQQQADRLRLRHQLGDQLDPLLPQLRVEVGDAGKVAARARETSPVSTGSTPVKKTIGIIDVASLATKASSAPPHAAITSTLRPTRSAANEGSRSYRNSAQRYSIATFCPSTQPVSPSPWRNAAGHGFAAGEPPAR